MIQQDADKEDLFSYDQQAMKEATENDLDQSNSSKKFNDRFVLTHDDEMRLRKLEKLLTSFRKQTNIVLKGTNEDALKHGFTNSHSSSSFGLKERADSLDENQNEDTLDILTSHSSSL